MSGSALYVYAVVPGPVPKQTLEGLTGIEGRPIRAIESPSGVAALVHDGDPVPYQGPDEDVKRWILEHSRVIEHAWDALGTILPVTFNVIVKGDDTSPAGERMRGWLEHSAESLRGRLDALRGRVELRVEIALDQAQAAADDPEVRRLRGELAAKPAGLRRLLERKLEQIEKVAVEHMADRLYPDLRRRIVAHSEHLSENRRVRSSPALVPVLSVALLVPRGAVEGLGAELARMEADLHAARIRFLGPWPAYSFSDVAVPGKPPA